jgi:Ca-activated chloride channel family protein
MASKVDAKFVNGTVYDENGNGIPSVNVLIKGSKDAVITDINGFYSIDVKNEKSILVFSLPGFITQNVRVGNKKVIDVILKYEPQMVEEEVLSEMEIASSPIRTSHKKSLNATGAMSRSVQGAGGFAYDMVWNHNTEEYATIHENGFRKTLDKPLSTFSIDVDAASYSNVRRFINNGQMPPKDAVRIEEMINYFGYDYKNPKGKDPFSINTELSRAPWNDEHLIVQVGLQGEKIEMNNLPASNIVFLLDVSGSMSSPNKLPLLKSAFKLLANELRPQDKVSIVVYAGAAGLVLPPTNGNDKKTMMEALDKLNAGGSTAGGEGIKLAYKTAMDNFVEGGNNRIVLATDGDFNIGASSNAFNRPWIWNGKL